MDPALISFLDHVVSGSPALIFAVMWWLERQDRKDKDDKLYKMLTGIGEMNEAWLKVLKSNGPPK